MGKLKIKKNDVWIDMTPMSDVMVLLLTFFMLSANFVKNEVVKVVTPSSQTESKVPKSATLDIMIKPDTINKGTAQEAIIGRVFLGTDKVVTMENALDTLLTKDFTKYKKDFYNNNVKNEALWNTFKAETQIGMPLKDLASYLGKTHEEMVKDLKVAGVPLDSIDGGMSEFQYWVKALKAGYKKWYKEMTDEKNETLSASEKAELPTKLDICIKADKETPYSTFKLVINELQDIMESRYKLLTQYKKPVEEKGN